MVSLLSRQPIFRCLKAMSRDIHSDNKFSSSSKTLSLMSSDLQPLNDRRFSSVKAITIPSCQVICTHVQFYIGSNMQVILQYIKQDDKQNSQSTHQLVTLLLPTSNFYERKMLTVCLIYHIQVVNVAVIYKVLPYSVNDFSDSTSSSSSSTNFIATQVLKKTSGPHQVATELILHSLTLKEAFRYNCKKTQQFTMPFKDDIRHLAGLKQQI